MIEQQREDIGRLCRHYHVSRLELAGSAARADFDPARSDLDFLVEFAGDQPAPALVDYFGLKEDLEALFGRPVDLIMPGAITNPYVRADIVRSCVTLYAA